MIDFSKPETRALFEAEVRKRMEEPFFMSLAQAEMLVASLMWERFASQIDLEDWRRDFDCFGTAVIDGAGRHVPLSRTDVSDGTPSTVSRPQRQTGEA